MERSYHTVNLWMYWKKRLSLAEPKSLAEPQTSKGTAEIIVQSTIMDTMKVWAYSLNAFCEVVEYLEAMEDQSSSNNMHKKEKKTIILYDQIDWDILRKKLEVSIW